MSSYSCVALYPAHGAALQQRRIASAMLTNPAAMQPSQTGALEAADDGFSRAESSAGLGDKFKLSRGE